MKNNINNKDYKNGNKVVYHNEDKYFLILNDKSQRNKYYIKKTNIYLNVLLIINEEKGNLLKIRIRYKKMNMKKEKNIK